MKIECSPEELVRLAKEMSFPSEPRQCTSGFIQSIPSSRQSLIAGLNAPPSKEMSDYLAEVGNFAYGPIDQDKNQSGPSSSESGTPAANPESTSDHHN